MTDENRSKTFMVLYQPVHLSFQRFCRARSNSEEDAKDLISETILKAYEGIHRLRDEKAFLAYLFGIASRVARRHNRRQKLKRFFHDIKWHHIEDQRQTPEQHLEVEFLYDALKKLPWKYQEAVALHFISGFSLQEVATIQESTLAAVKVRILRGKTKLRKILGIAQVISLEPKRVNQSQVTK